MRLANASGDPRLFAGRGKNPSKIEAIVILSSFVKSYRKFFFLLYKSYYNIVPKRQHYSFFISFYYCFGRLYFSVLSLSARLSPPIFFWCEFHLQRAVDFSINCVVITVRVNLVF